MQVVPSRVTDVAGTRVMRALPRRARRTIGAWCFLDHARPASVDDPPGMIGPHPHIGLQTVTWLIEGELLHTDSIGSGEATVLVGRLGAARSSARTDSPLMGADLAFGGTADLPLDPAFEHGLVVLVGSIAIGDVQVGPDELVYLGPGRDEVRLAADGPARVLLLGGEPIGDILIWWNFVARTREEIEAAARDWESRSGRFGDVRSDLAWMPAPRASWSS